MYVGISRVPSQAFTSDSWADADMQHNATTDINDIIILFILTIYNTLQTFDSFPHFYNIYI